MVLINKRDTSRPILASSQLFSHARIADMTGHNPRFREEGGKRCSKFAIDVLGSMKRKKHSSCRHDFDEHCRDVVSQIMAVQGGLLRDQDLKFEKAQPLPLQDGSLHQNIHLKSQWVHG